jgi:hypothetical protein
LAETYNDVAASFVRLATQQALLLSIVFAFGISPSNV